jgi:hypothetical protein
VLELESAITIARAKNKKKDWIIRGGIAKFAALSTLK